MELDYLEDFMESSVRFLRNASHASDERRRRLGNSIGAIAGNVECLYGELYTSDVLVGVIISCVTLLERNMRVLARGLNIGLELDLGVGDLSGSLVERFRKYCTKVARVDTGLGEVHWQNIKQICEIRNCLVHFSGNIHEFNRRSEIVEFAARHGTPKIEESFVRVEEETVKVVLNVLRSFLDNVYRSALQRFPRDSSGASR